MYDLQNVSEEPFCKPSSLQTVGKYKNGTQTLYRGRLLYEMCHVNCFEGFVPIQQDV